MNNNAWIIAGGATAVILTVGLFARQFPPQSLPPAEETRAEQTRVTQPTGELSESAITALKTAIDDEYHALSTYQAVIEKFGTVRPFSMIIGAEEQHIASLKAIFDKYGIEIPANTWDGKAVAPATLQEACQIGVDAEIANADLYRSQLLPAVSEYPDITSVFENLMNASQDKHLPAFERCN